MSSTLVLCFPALLIIAASCLADDNTLSIQVSQTNHQMARRSKEMPQLKMRKVSKDVALDDVDVRFHRSIRRKAQFKCRNKGNKHHGLERCKVEGRHLFGRQEMRLLNHLAVSNQEFALSLYPLLSANWSELIFSPYGIHTTMTMAYLGARGATSRQMIHALKLKKLKKEKAHMAYAALTRSLHLPSNVTLDVANGMYVKQYMPVEQVFQLGLQNMYNATFDHLNLTFPGGPEKPINDFVFHTTHHKIENFLQPGTITQDVALIIINVIYFKGGWLYKFKSNDTKDLPFYQSNTRTVTVPMMAQYSKLLKYSRSNDLQAHVLELPYEDQRYSMFVLLPFERNSLPDLEQRLNMKTLISALESVVSSKIDAIYLPKFKIRSKFSIKDGLKSIEFSHLFDCATANFSGISSVGNLYVSDVIHMAAVEVSEEGTEASAATDMIFHVRSYWLPKSSVIFRADHPFLFLIRDQLSKTVLFMGKYSASLK